MLNYANLCGNFSDYANNFKFAENVELCGKLRKNKIVTTLQPLQLHGVF